MNSDRIPPSEDGDEDAKQIFREFFAAAAEAKREQDQFGKAAPGAMQRLVRACYGHDNSQAITVARCLASIYNGSEARPVQLDEIRWLDWSLQRDLVTVMIGTGHAGFEDTAIREAFRAIGGDTAVEWLHWFTTGGPHRAALKRLVLFVKENAHSSSAGTVRNALRSLYNGNTVLSVHKLTYLGDELGVDMSLVIEGIVGRDSGSIRENDIETAFNAAGILSALTEDEFPPVKTAR